MLLLFSVAVYTPPPPAVPAIPLAPSTRNCTPVTVNPEPAVAVADNPTFPLTDAFPAGAVSATVVPVLAIVKLTVAELPVSPPESVAVADIVCTPFE